MVIFHEHVAQNNNDWVTLRKHVRGTCWDAIQEQIGERIGNILKDMLGNILGICFGKCWAECLITISINVWSTFGATCWSIFLK